MERLDNSKLSPIQKYIVNMISEKDRIAIIGGPGTGKTILAMSGMSKEQSKKQILLTYSNPLSRMIQGCDITSKTVHSFCLTLARKMEEKLDMFIEEHQGQHNSEVFSNIIIREYGCNFTKSPWPQWDKLIESYNKLSSQDQKDIRYEAIFVDEGQDLPNEAYEFFCKIADRIVVTFDEAQEVGREVADSTVKLMRTAEIDCNRILSVLNMQESFYDLIDNFRNTKSIEKVAKLFYNNFDGNVPSLCEGNSVRNEGTLPKVICSSVTQTMIDKLSDTAYQLNKQIGIIVQNKNTFSSIKEMVINSVQKGIIPEHKFFYKYGNENNMENNKNNLNQTGVFLVTYQSAKGMEFDEVYIMDCEKLQLNTPAEKNKLYVAITRAKDKLNLVFDCSEAYRCPVLNAIHQNETLFDIER